MTAVDCLTCREALSARLDGEEEPAPAAETDRHLASCAECRAWETRVTQTSRLLRVREAIPVPDLSSAILATAVPPQSTRGWWARIALVSVAIAQVGLALTQVLGSGVSTGHGGSHAAVPAAEHLFNESTAWNLAIGVGLLWAAFRSRGTSGLIPVLAGFVLVVGVYSVQDLVSGTVAVTRVLEHALLLLALGLLIVINRRYGDPAPHHEASFDDEGLQAGDDEPERAPAGDGTVRRTPLRPAGRHRAA
jgi:predicted anti-sigma-YlaC factor YlaD